MDRTTKMSDMASFEANNVDTAKLLLCYVLFKIAKPVPAIQLYEITVKSGVINYFYYHEAIAALIENGSLHSVSNEENEELFELSSKGVLLSKNFKSYIPKSFRDRLVTSAIKYFSDIKLKNEYSIDFIKTEKGIEVHFSCFDGDIELMDLKLFAPDMTQAELIANKIRINPVGFYSSVLGYVIGNSEEVIKLDENN